MKDWNKKTIVEEDEKLNKVKNCKNNNNNNNNNNKGCSRYGAKIVL